MADTSYNIYLSGPEIFYTNYEEILSEKNKICRKYGFVGIPNDNTALVAPYNDFDIFMHDMDLLAMCPIIVANLTSFRGPEPDSGTVWECAYGIANKKRVYGYCDFPDMVTAVEKRYSAVTWKEVNGFSTPYDSDGVRIENWGNSLNLMLTHSVNLVQGTFEDAMKLVARDYSVRWRR